MKESAVLLMFFCSPVSSSLSVLLSHHKFAIFHHSCVRLATVAMTPLYHLSHVLLVTMLLLWALRHVIRVLLVPMATIQDCPLVKAVHWVMNALEEQEDLTLA